VFGDYIQDLLREACENSKGIDLIHDEMVDMTSDDDGSFQLLSRQGKTLRALQVVLALGNFPPAENHGTGKAPDRPWLVITLIQPKHTPNWPNQAIYSLSELD
jgi:uncharacterized NAD(P)/FAD-binding protein YdhS